MFNAITIAKILTDMKEGDKATLKLFVSHKQLVAILETGTPEEFRNGMRNHLENNFARLFD